MNFRRLTRYLILLLVLAGCGGPATSAGPQSATPVAPAVTEPTSVPPAAVERTPLVVFGAGSLIAPFDALAQAFEARYPAIDVQAEYHGSIQVIRHATELHEPIDVVATADASLIPMLMYAQTAPETGRPYAEWDIRFASNHLALAYTDQSRYAAEINADNWYTLLTDREVKTGLADPRFDASGYRALMAFALAQPYYRRPTLFAEMFNGRFRTPVTIFQDDDLTTITVPEIVEPQPDTGLVVRGPSIQLIALLQSGDLDYAFEYESVIRQHGLKLLRLPDALNLGAAAYEATYNQVQVNLDFRRFASVKPEFRGERIGYGITIPTTAPHPQAAAQFIAFLLGPEGRAVMEQAYQPLFDSPIGDRYAQIPPDLQSLCVPAP